MKTKIINCLKTLFLLVTTSLIFFACKKNIYPDVVPETPAVVTPIDFTTKVNSNVSGFVTNENNLPVLGATVKVGSVTTTTNRFGFFEVKNVQVVKTAATVTVVNSGYFNGIKTYMAEDGKSAFFRIKLLPKTSVGTIASASGGTATSNGVKVSLPANAVVNAATNVAYTGNIAVAIKFINPTSTEINNIMPGDLRGIDGNSNLKLLTSYGMAAVELTGSAGELLQIATGKKATLTMPIPASILASSPASIPLWYFDEAKGLWKEEGSATKTGSEYIGDVSHFSFWNCDLPNAIVPLSFTVVNSSGSPLNNGYVEITPTSIGSVGHAGGYLNASGYVSLFVTPNTSYQLSLFSNHCGVSAPFYTQNFTVTTLPVSLGTITINNASNNAIINGTATNCNNTPLSNGRVYIYANNIYSEISVSTNASFSFVRQLCNGPENVQIIAEDLTTNQVGVPQQFTIVSGTNNVGNLQACGTSTTQFINFTVNGNSTNFTTPTSGFNQYLIANNIYLYGYNNSQQSGNASLSFGNNGIGLNTIQPLNHFSASVISDSTYAPNPINVAITEYGAVGQYISGNFSGIVRGTNPPNTNYNVVCSFRMKRNQ